MAEQNKQKQRRRLTGTVVSTKMDKTALVRVDRTMVHSKYQKRYTESKKYKVHDEQNQLKEGDVIIFEECRPLSKDKKWRMISKIK